MIARASSSVGSAQINLAVITVCRNALEDLKITVESVQNQSADGILHIVVDGGSTDGSSEWLRAHRDLFFVAVSEPDNGIYDAMNKAVSLCPEVEWIIFMNAGDVFHNTEVLALSTIELQRKDVDFIFGAVEIREAAGPGRSKIYPARQYVSNMMPGCHQACFVRGSLMKQLGFDLNYRVAGDFAFWLRATHEARCKTGVIGRVIATIAPEGFSAQNEPKLQEEYVNAISVFLTRKQALAWLVNRKLRRLLLSLRDLVLR